MFKTLFSWKNAVALKSERNFAECSVKQIKKYRDLPHYLVLSESLGDGSASSIFLNDFSDESIQLTGIDHHYKIGDSIYIDMPVNGLQPFGAGTSRNIADLSGIVICLSAQTLFQRNGSSLKDLSTMIRKCICDIEGGEDGSLPVSIYISNCNAIDGMTEFASEYSKTGFYQFPYSFNNGKPDKEFILSVFDHCYEQLCIQRLDILSRGIVKNKIFPEIEFPEVFYLLKEKLVLLFSDMFLSGGESLSHVSHKTSVRLQALCFSCSTQENSGYKENLCSSNGFIAMQDNKMLSAQALKKDIPLWRGVMSKVTVFAWLLFLFFYCVLLLFSFSKNQALIDQVYRTQYSIINYSNPEENSVDEINSLRQLVLQIDKMVSYDGFSVVKFHHGEKLVIKLKELVKDRCVFVGSIDYQNAACQ